MSIPRGSTRFVNRQSAGGLCRGAGGTPAPTHPRRGGTAQTKFNLMALVCITLLHAQSFDVASVKRSAADSQFSFSLAHGRISAHDVDVRDLIRAAYRILDFQISGAPNWLSSEAYDVEAGSDRPADAAKTRLMLRALLADRFRLKIRRESKGMAVLALRVSRGSKVKLTPADATGCDLDPTAVSRCGNLHGSPNSVITAEKVTMTQFATMLSAMFGQIVRDETGLTGVFDFKIDLVAAGLTPAPPSASSEMDGINVVMSGLRDQLGLKLEHARSTVEMLVIEHIERPSAN